MAINLTVAYVKMLHCDWIDASEKIDVNKLNKSKECKVFHY